MIYKPKTDMNDSSELHGDKWIKHAFNSRGSNLWPIKSQPLMMIQFVILWIMNYKLLAVRHHYTCNIIQYIILWQLDGKNNLLHL